RARYSRPRPVRGEDAAHRNRAEQPAPRVPTTGTTGRSCRGDGATVRNAPRLPAIRGDMRAAVIEGPDSPPVVREMPAPAPGPGDDLIAVSSAALNPHDQVVAAGINFAAPYPYVTGIECVGRTENVRRVYVAPTNLPHRSPDP